MTSHSSRSTKQLTDFGLPVLLPRWPDGRGIPALVMSIFIIFISAFLLTSHTVLASIIPAPPSISRSPPREILFKIDLSTADSSKAQPKVQLLILECEANAEPAANFTWRKNGEAFHWWNHSERITQLAGRGTLHFYSVEDDDVGFYQCVASNVHGTALSSGTSVRQAVLDSFPATDNTPLLRTAVEGDSLSIPCTNAPYGYPKPTLFWFEQQLGKQLQGLRSPRLSVDPHGTLHFTNVTKADEREHDYYVCVASSDFRGEMKMGPKVNLKVTSYGYHDEQKKPPVEQYISPANMVAMRGKSLDIYCIYSGTPIPKIKWRRVGGELPEGRHNIEAVRGHVLEIRRVEIGDEGLYSCEASNGHGATYTRKFNVNVQSTPYWKRDQENVQAAEEEDVEFECLADGISTPKVRWMVNGIPIEEAPYNSRRQVMVSRNALRIDSLVKSDTAVYQCNATNEHGYAFQDFYLNVLALPPELTEPPLPSYEVVENKPVTISCKVFGAPKPNVSWEHNDAQITPSRHFVQLDGDLLIKSVDFDDAGQFRCVAVNKFGTIKSGSNLGYLEVRENTKIVTAPDPAEVAVGQTVAFRCSAHVDQHLELRVDWLRNGQKIDYDQDPRMFFSEADKTLTISKIKQTDMGSYTCMASTRLDSANASADLVVQDVPDPPLLLDVTCSSHSARVEWSPQADNRAPIIGYIIQYNTTFDEDNWEDAFSQIPDNTHRFDVALSPWANYSFRVLARNKIGVSLPGGHSAICKTPTDVPFKNPENVEGRGNKPNNMIISWKPMPPIDHNAPGFFYRVYWRRLSTGNSEESEDYKDYTPYVSSKKLDSSFNGESNGKKSNNNKVGDLLDHDQYIDVEEDKIMRDGPMADDSVDVDAFERNALERSKDKRRSDYKSPDFLDEMEAKASQYRLKHVSAADIDYSSTEDEDKRVKQSAITSVDEMTEKGWHYKNITDWKQSIVIVENTLTFKPYRIRVEAHNVLGQANLAAVEITGYSGEDVPTERPGNLTLIDVLDAATASLSWTPVNPKSVQGHFKGYKIQAWTSKFGPERKRELTVSPDTTKVRAQIFVPHAHNFVHVFAYNGQYNGPASETLDFTTPEGKPGPCETFEAVAMGSNGLYLAWKKPKQEDQNGVLTGYRVTYQIVDGVKLGPIMERVPEITDPNETGVKLSGLEPATKYRVTIQAMTSAGSGEPYFVEAETRSTQPRPPGKPSFIWNHVKTGNSKAAIRVRWLADIEGQAGSYFYVKYKKKGEVQYSKSPEEHFELNVILDNLDQGTVYEMAVVSVDGGYYTSSDQEEVETWGTGKAYYHPRPVQNFATAGWFIGMMLAILFVLVVLIVICLVKKNRGGKYDVHEREVERGKKDYDYPDDGGFNEYTKGRCGERNQLMGSKTSINSSLKPAESDTDSMAEYGEGETGKFNEEGSFIGAYRPKKRDDKSNAVATFV